MASTQHESVQSYFSSLEYSLAVNIDHRALIEKVLARYSTKLAAFRELISNAADASATKVKIQIKTSPHEQDNGNILSGPSLGHVRHHNIVREIVVHNNGRHFSADDWSRLASIGDGNPNIGTIGMFGLGFYSVFELSDEPIILSGKEALAFQWKGRTLYHKHVELPPTERIQDTRIIMKYKNLNTKVPDLIELGQLLACSIAFVNLSNIELWLDDWKILSLNKIVKNRPISSTGIQMATEHMSISKIEQGILQVDATWLDGIYDEARLPPPMTTFLPMEPVVTRTCVSLIRRLSSSIQPAKLQMLTSSAGDNSSIEQNSSAEPHSPVVLHPSKTEESSPRVSNGTMYILITTASVLTRIQGHLASGIEAITGKKAPGIASVSLLTSCSGNSNSCPLFKLALPSKSEFGRVFIGLPTLQTTGLRAHVLIPSIPDVHRGLIDLNSEHVRVWNEELLQVAGLLGRVIWTEEMKAIKLASPSSAGFHPHKKGWILEKTDRQLVDATRLFRLFDFQPSTPNPKVGRIIQEYFWRACNSIDIFSTQGVQNSVDVRLEDKRIAGFVHGFPMLSSQFATRYGAFVRKLHTSNLISNISTTDIQYELSRKALDRKELGRLLDWALSVTIELWQARNIIKAATIEIPGRPNYALKDVEYFIEYDIPSELLPERTIPYAYVREHVSTAQLQKIGWQPLPVVEWIFLSKPNLQKFMSDSVMTEKVLTIISSNLTEEKYGEVVDHLPKVPTTRGMMSPRESYFRLTTPFQDLEHLPYVKEMPGVCNGLLDTMGVRRVVEMNVVVEHLQSVRDDPATLEKYISYLIEIPQPLSEKDKKYLCAARVWYAELQNQDDYDRDTKYRLDELFEPVAELRKLQVPILYLPQVYDGQRGPMGKILRLLGLKPYPSVPELLQIMKEAISSRDYERRDRALRYFIDNFEENNYKAHDLSGTSDKFLPLEEDPTEHVAPKDCFTNDQVTLLGYPTLARRFRYHAAELGVKSDPPLKLCVDRLVENPPSSIEKAADTFEYFWSFRAILEPHLSRLKSSAIVPVFEGGSLRYVTPRECYVGPFGFDLEELADLFVYTRFKRGSMFLELCGARSIPSANTIAETFIYSSQRVLEVLKTTAIYIKWFVWLGDQYRKQNISSQLRDALRKSSFLPTISRNDGRKTMVLTSPEEAVIYDDFRLFRLFRDTLYIVPQRDDIESFCHQLGCKRLSAAVQTDFTLGQQIYAHDIEPLKFRVLEQLKVFLDCLDPHRVKISWGKLRDNLQISLVEEISLRWTYRRAEKIGQTTAFAKRVGSMYWLWIVSGEFEAHDLSRELVKLTLKAPKPVDFLLFETILHSSLEALKKRSYDIERVAEPDLDMTLEPLYQVKREEPGHISAASSVTKSTLGSQIELPRAVLTSPDLGKGVLTTDNSGARSSIAIGSGNGMRIQWCSSDWSKIPQYDIHAPEDTPAVPHSDYDFMNLNGRITSCSPPSTMLMAKDPQETRYLGELYMSNLLCSRLAPESYNPEKHWTSTMRSRNGHTPFTGLSEGGSHSSFTIIQECGDLRKAILKACQIDDSSLDRRCTFHIEVCATNQGLHGPLKLSSVQYLKAKSMSRRSETAIKDVFILARVYKITHDPGIALYADPWQLHRKGLISLEMASTNETSMSEIAPAISMETSGSGNSSLEMKGIYKGLRLNEEQFRLIQLELDLDDNAPLRCKLNRFSADRTEFSAISYVWGPHPLSLSPYRLEVNQVPIPITESLFTCLRSLRRKGHAALLWVDAICINQEDDIEKSMQVRRMGTLYSKAKQVIIWMGDDGDEDRGVIESLLRLPGLTNNECEIHEHLAGDRVDAFLRKAWFTRTWTIQELVFGSDVIIMSETSQIEWNVFMAGIHKYVQYSKSNHAQGKGNKRYVLRNSSPALALDYVRTTFQGHTPSSRRLKFGFLEVLEMFFYTKSSQPRDKLFALLNMAHNTGVKPRFMPDYASNETRILSRYARQFVKEGLALELLYRAGINKGSRFCSWIPDLMNLRGTQNYAPTITTWAAAGSRSASAFCAGGFRPSGSRTPGYITRQDQDNQRAPILAIKGKVFDSIISCRPLKISSDSTVIQFSELLEDFRRYISPFTQELSDDSKNNLMIRFFIGDAVGPQLNSSPSFFQKEEATCSEEWPSGLTNEVLNVKPLLDGRELRNRSAEARRHISEYWQTACNFMGKIPKATACVTKHNYVGMVPGQARPGDKIFIASGAKVPFLIRECQEMQDDGQIGPNVPKTRYYTLEGECYIDGIMYYNKDSLVESKKDKTINLI